MVVASAAVLQYGENQPRSISDIARHAFWTASEAAMVLRCSVRTLRTELRRGTVMGIQIGRRWRVPVSQFGVSVAPASVLEHSPGRTVQAGSPPNADPLRLSDPVSEPPHQHSVPQPQDRQPTLRIRLLGRPQIFIDDVRVVELERSHRRSELIQLLALHREGLGGAQIAALLNMASHQYEEESLDPHYVRTLVWGVRDQARKKTGWDGIIESPAQHGRGAHRYQLPENTVCDLWEFQDKLDQADRLAAYAARVEVSGRGILSSLVQSSIRKVQKVQGGLPARTQAQEEALAQAAALREEALRLYRGDYCEGSANGCLAEAARMIEERYISSAVEQGDYWRWVAFSTQACAGSFPSQKAALATDEVVAGETALDRVTVPARPGEFPPQLQPGLRAAWREALLNYERVLQIDPYHEDACIRAMECYAALGNARGVGLTFNRHQEILKLDLRQVPSPRVMLAHDKCKGMLSLARSEISKLAPPAPRSRGEAAGIVSISRERIL